MLVFELKTIAAFPIIHMWQSCPTGGQALKAECWHLNARGIRRKMTPESAEFSRFVSVSTVVHMVSS